MRPGDHRNEAIEPHPAAARRRIAIVTSGSRGDVQPFLALALGLQHAGHEVRLVTHAAFRTWITDHGIEYWPLDGDPRELLKTPEGQQFIKARNPVSFLRGCRNLVRVSERMLREQVRDSLAAATGMDAIIYSFGAPLASVAADKLGLPHVSVALAPMSRTKAFPAILLAGRNFGPLLNYLSHRAFEGIVELFLRSTANNIRRDHGLAPVRVGRLFQRHYEERVPMLTALSPAVVPVPADWPAWHAVTGYWILGQEGAFEPPAELTAFLVAGAPPVYVGFGSMVDPDPVKLTELVVKAAEVSGRRLLISKGWSNLGATKLPSSVFLLGDVPHEWLFQKVAAIVHHGGAGTTAAALRAGVPSLVVPFGVDQPFWGHRVAALGAGPKPISRGKLNADSLAAAFVRMTTDPAMREVAANLGRELRQERGVEMAVRVLEAYFKGR